VNSVAEMRNLGVELAADLRAGDLLTLSGPLGAGKTALTQGIGAGLGISGITSPTFVISKVYEGRLPLIHVDAYRLLGSARQGFEFDDLDIDTARDSAVTVIEWGSEIAPRLSEEYLEINIEFAAAEDERLVSAIGHGARWQGVLL